MLVRTERHIFVGNKQLEDLCNKSALLYNAANYEMRQSFINTGKIPGAYDLINKFQADEQFDYRNLPAQPSQQTIMLLNKNWKSFFRAVKEYKKNSKKFTGRPRLPRYKQGVKQNIVVFTNQQITLKDGYINFPKAAKLWALKTHTTDIQQVRIIPQATCHVIEVVYKAPAKAKAEVDDKLFLSIDLGVSNFATCVSNVGQPFIVNGRPVKSMNQFFNKQKAVLQSYIGDKGTSNRINHLTHKRNCKVHDYCHKTSRYIVDYCVTNHIGRIIIGNNVDWKCEVNMGKRNNQNFVSIPFGTLISQIQYKAEEVGIVVETVEESYTSKVDHWAGEEMKHHESYSGKRVKRGMFKSSTGKIVNADVNGAVGIGRKVIGNGLIQDLLDRGVVLTPVKVGIF